MSEWENKQISLSINPVGTYQHGVSHKRPAKTQVAKTGAAQLSAIFSPGIDAKSLHISASQIANSHRFVPFVFCPRAVYICQITMLLNPGGGVYVFFFPPCSYLRLKVPADAENTCSGLQALKTPPPPLLPPL